MTLEEIKKAIDAGARVYHGNRGYEVVRDNLGRYLIQCVNGYCIALTWADGRTLNGKPEEFFVG